MTHILPHDGKRRRQAVWGLASVMAATVCVTGCSRAYYRRQADDQVTELVDCLSEDPTSPIHNFTIQPDPRSRMFDPFCPDAPPMPEDDPRAHQLMECVDCKQGSRCWNCYGKTGYVENPLWRSYLPIHEDGTLVLDQRGAIQMAVLQSPNYQRQLETVYLSALDVTFERFRFDTQFFGGHSTFLTLDGRNRAFPGGRSSSLLRVSPLPGPSRLRAQKMFASGGELVVGLANSLVWEFSGSNSHVATSLVDFAFFQPLLRAGGRARVLERLTSSERTLLANVRQVERFRRGFYAEIVSGVSAGPGPGRQGGFFGGPGLQGFSGVGGDGFGRVGSAINRAGGRSSRGLGAPEAGGFLGLLQRKQRIQNQRANLAALRDSVSRLEALFDAGRIDRFQVDLARQAMYDIQSVLLASEAQFQAEKDGFKVSIGLPPDLEIRVEDSLIDDFSMMDPELVELRTAIDRSIVRLRSHPSDGSSDPQALSVAQALDEAGPFAIRSEQLIERVFQDYDRLLASAPARRRTLARLVDRQAVASNSSPFDVLAFDQRVESIQQSLADANDQIVERWQHVDYLRQIQDEPDLDVRAEVIQTLTELSQRLTDLSLVQARARLESAVLPAVELTSDQAVEIARENRRDWMNARSRLVDIWRRIQFNANDLESGLNLFFSGDLGNRGNNPAKFRDTQGRLRVGFEFDAPLTRLGERNIYRQALIEYQRARREFYQIEDQISQAMRDTLRTIRMDEVNLELRRAAVRVAISQVELARLRLDRPPRPGESTRFGDTTASNLVQALAALLTAQNDFLNVWVDYHVQRLALDFDLGTMQLDSDGVWVDPGTYLGCAEASELHFAGDQP